MSDVNTGWRPASEVPKLDYYQGWNDNLFNLIPLDSRKVLEIGCAKGMLGAAVKKRNGDVHYTGIEMVEAAAAVAREKLDEVHVADVESFDWSLLSGRTFDCVVFGDVLEHLIDPKKTLLAVARLLGRNGSVVCCIPNVGHWSILFGLMQGKWDYADSGLLDRTHLRFFTPRTFIALLEDCGLKPQKEVYVRTEFEVPQEFVLFLKKMAVDVEAFMLQATTYQFLMRSTAIPKAVPAHRANPVAGGRITAPTVAVIVAVSGEVGLTRGCLESMARHYPENIAPEVTVFDNGSGDGTQAYLEGAQQQYDWLKVIRSGSDLGYARACNKAVELSKADIVVFLSHAVEVLPGWLESLLDLMGDESVGMVGSKVVDPGGSIRHAGMAFTGEGMPVPMRSHPDQSDAALDRMKEVPAVTGACAMIRRDLFLSVGGMDREYPRHFIDVDLGFKVREKGLKVVYQPGSVVTHRGGATLASLEAKEADWLESGPIFIRKWRDHMLKDISRDPRFFEAGRDYAPR